MPIAARFPILALVVTSTLAFAADDGTPIAPDAETLDKVTVNANADPNDTSAPGEASSPIWAIDSARLDNTVFINTEDALKYAPNLHVRKRYIGDNNAVVSVRSTSSRQSAHTLVYADGLLLSNLLGSDFSFPPRWSLVTPDEIERVDVLYGPYSARYPGNSLGATILLHTRMPKAFEASANVQYFSQSYDHYGIDRAFDGFRAGASIGSRSGPWSYRLDIDHLDSAGQPLSYFTTLRSTSAAGAADVPVTGAVPWTDQLGRAGYLFGVNSEGLTDTVNDQLKFKVGFDITPTLQAALTVVDWRQRIDNGTGSFLRDADGNTISSGAVAIDGFRYSVPANAFAPANSESERRLYGFTVRSDNDVGWNGSLVASRFETRRDIVRTASSAGDGPGTVTFGDGTGWTTFDAGAENAPAAFDGAHALAIGLHADVYELDNATWNSADWRSGSRTSFNNAFAGRTRTLAVFVEDRWTFASDWSLIPGLRYEHWRASDGRRALGDVSLDYAERSQGAWSPKLALSRELGDGWSARLSLARAVRLPTVSELFQGRITGTTIVNNDPNLKPEDAFSKDLTIDRVLERSRLRFSLYEDDVDDALFSQTNTTVFPNITNIQNVDRVRTRGAEIAFDASDVLFDGFDVSASVARNHAKILRNDNNPATVGKFFYRIPNWRADLLGTWRITPWVSTTLAARYSGRQYNTLDNTDINPRTFGGTSRYFVIDAKVAFVLGAHATLGVGVENLNDEEYYVFHPYPGRTWVAEARVAY